MTLRSGGRGARSSLGLRLSGLRLLSTYSRGTSLGDDVRRETVHKTVPAIMGPAVLRMCLKDPLGVEVTEAALCLSPV